MWKKRCCGGGSRFPSGGLLIALGIGILLAYIIPYHILITMLGVALIVAGIRVIIRR